MKEKLAVALFASSTQALVFCVFHDDVLGSNYKVTKVAIRQRVFDDSTLQRCLR